APVLWRFIRCTMSTGTWVHHCNSIPLPRDRHVNCALYVSNLERRLPLTFSIWNAWLISESMFHHSNVELPYGVGRWLCKIIVTLRMHGIHHGVVPEELNSNWSSG